MVSGVVDLETMLLRGCKMLIHDIDWVEHGEPVSIDYFFPDYESVLPRISAYNYFLAVLEAERDKYASTSI